MVEVVEKAGSKLKSTNVQILSCQNPKDLKGAYHSQTLHHWVFTSSPQQSPSSQLHPALLLSSSQYPSPCHCGDPQILVEVVVVVVVVVVEVVVENAGSRLKFTNAQIRLDVLTNHCRLKLLAC